MRFLCRWDADVSRCELSGSKVEMVVFRMLKGLKGNPNQKCHCFQGRLTKKRSQLLLNDLKLTEMAEGNAAPHRSSSSAPDWLMLSVVES